MSALWVLVFVVPMEPVLIPLAVSPVYVTLDTLEMGHSVPVSATLGHNNTRSCRICSYIIIIMVVI